MSKRPIPVPKEDDALDNFINEAPSTAKKEVAKFEPKKVNKKEETKEEENLEEDRVKKSLKIKTKIDDALRLESATTREKQQDIMETAIREYLVKKGHKNI